jgi:hypothetical protein
LAPLQDVRPALAIRAAVLPSRNQLHVVSPRRGD